MRTYREYLLGLCEDLEIGDEEAGEPNWQAHLSDSALADAISGLRPKSNVAKRVGDGWYTGDAEYVVSGMASGSRVTRGDGMYFEVIGACGMSSHEEALEAAELLARGEKDDADYNWYT